MDRRTDIFSFGVLAYELLAQRRPFTGPSPAAILDAIVTREPEPLAAAAPDAPPALAHLVERAIQKQPPNRYNSMDGIRRELLEIRAALRGPEPASASRPVPSDDVAVPDTAHAPTRRPNLPITLILFAIVAAILIWLLTQSSP